MRKIKEYINNKPKLKRGLKILGVIAVILSVAFNILIIGVGSCSNKSKEALADNTPIATTPIHRSANFNDTIYYYSNSNFIGQSSLMTWTRYLDLNQLGDSNGKWDIFNHDLNINQEVYYSYNFTNNNTYYYLDSNVSGTGIKYVNQVRFKKVKVNNQLDYYEIKFMSAGYGVVNFEYRVWHDLNREQIEHTGYTTDLLNGIILNCNMYSSYSSDYVTDGILCCNRYSDSFLYDCFNANYYSIDYNAGYNAGYNTGREYGYELGYDSGYQVGYSQGGQDSNVNAFTLISNAFTSLGSILNIQLIPGITLATLIFTPLIITLIIVIVKMFRG